MAIKRLNVASEDTLQGVKSDVADVKTDVAGVKVDVANVNSNIGGTADTGGSSSEGTSMAKLNYLIESLKTVLNSTTGTAGLKTLDKIIEEKVNAAVSSITANGGVKVVKSVQRGHLQGEQLSYKAYYKDITIKSVNMSKSIVIYTSGEGYQPHDEPNTSNGGDYYYYPTATLINSTTLRLYRTNSVYDSDHAYITGDWQVIEFY